MWLTTILPFLKTYWKVIVVVLAVLSLVGYIKILHWQIDSCKKENLELTLVIQQANAKSQKLEDHAKALTEKYEDSLKEKQKKVDDLSNTLKERIKKNEESRRVKLSSNVVGLFNASKSESRSEPVAEAKPSDDGGASTPAQVTTTLNDLLLVSAENDKNHLKCIDQVHEWQRFWKDFAASVGSVNESP